jgi:hypothetical protein
VSAVEKFTDWSKHSKCGTQILFVTPMWPPSVTCSCYGTDQSLYPGPLKKLLNCIRNDCILQRSGVKYLVQKYLIQCGCVFTVALNALRCKIETCSYFCQNFHLSYNFWLTIYYALCLCSFPTHYATHNQELTVTCNAVLDIFFT